MEHRPTRAQLRRWRRLRTAILAACCLVMGFGLGIIATLKAVGFT